MSSGVSALLALFLLAQAPEPDAVTPPSLSRFVQAELPPGTAMRDADVVLVLTIDVLGAVTAVEVRSGIGEPYDGAATTAARQFGFEPARAGGEPIAVIVPFTYQYRKPTRRGPILGERRPRADLEPAPGHSVVGRLVEKGTRSPRIGFPVRLRDPRTGRVREVVTDAEGRFSFDGLPPRKQQLQVFSSSYRDLRKTVATVEGPPDPAREDVTLYLQPGGYSAFRTVVRKEREPAAATQVDLTDDELRKVPGTFGDPTRVVATLPGVSRTPFGLGFFVVRGANFENTGFFIDGHPVFYLYHLLGGPGVLHPELIGRLTFYPGGYPARYGRFAAGAVVLETKDPPRDRWHLDAEVDLFKASALYSQPVADGKGQVTISARRSYYELILPLFTDGIDLEYTDYQARFTYDLRPNLRLRVMALGAEDTFAATGIGSDTDTDSALLSIGFHRLQAALHWDLSRALAMTHSVMAELDHTNNRRIAEGDDDIRASATIGVVQHRGWLTWKPDDDLMVEGGLDTIVGRAGFDLEFPTLPPLGDPKPPKFDPIVIPTRIEGAVLSVAPYVLAEWEVARGLTLLPGVRANADVYAERLHWTADPRLSARLEASELLTLKAMSGMSHQFPQLPEFEDPYGDPTIPMVEAIQGALGFELDHEDWHFSLEGFYNHLWNLSRPNAIVASDGEGLERVLWTNDMQGRAWGAEVLLRKRMSGRTWGWLSYTLSNAERLRPPADWIQYELDQTHVLNLAWSVALGGEVTIGARFQLVSGNPYYPITGATLDADRGEYIPTFSQTRGRLEPFHRLDVRIDKRIRFETWLLDVYLDVQNAYNQVNPESKTYEYDYSKQIAGPTIPILPTFGLHAAF